MRKFNITFIIVHLIIIFLACLPILCVLTGSAMGAIFGFRVDESGSSHYNLLGIDIAQIASSLFVCGWFALFTLPIGAIILPISIICHIIGALILAKRKN